MHQLIYLSSATELFTKAKLLALLERSQANNARAGVTGLLLYSNGNFMQILEGEETVVRSLFQTISADTRHAGALEISSQPVARRDFPDWSMGFKDVSFDSDIEFPGFNQILNHPLTADQMSRLSGKVRILLQTFKKNML